MTTLAHPLQPTWRRWLVPRASDWLPACLYVGVLLDYLFLHYRSLFSGETLLLVAVLGTLVASERWEHWRYGEHAPRPIGIGLLLLNLVLIEIAVQIDYEGIGAFLYLILPLKAWLAFGQRAGYMFSIAISVLYLIRTLQECIAYGIPIESGLSNTMLFVTGVAFVLTISHLATVDRRGRERAEDLLGELERSHSELAAYAARSADMAAVAERSRIARDIHDSLGHYLTALNIQLEKALAFHEHDREEAQRTLQSAKRLAHEALADVRRSVGLLRSRPTPFSLASMLRDLVALHGNGPPCVELNIDGDETSFAVETRLVLYRVAQEGLTNIRRHAQARHAKIDLHWSKAQALLTISDDGIGFPTRLDTQSITPSTGFGLQGMRERIALIGGSMEIASKPHQGTTITVYVPGSDE
jgi:signal transduction histidine kinase